MNLEIRVRRFRTALGLSQEQFAKYLGVNTRTIVRWEKGQPIPVEGLARLFKASAEEVAKGANDLVIPDDSFRFLLSLVQRLELSEVFPATPEEQRLVQTVLLGLRLGDPRVKSFARKLIGPFDGSENEA